MGQWDMVNFEINQLEKRDMRGWEALKVLWELIFVETRSSYEAEAAMEEVR